MTPNAVRARSASSVTLARLCVIACGVVTGIATARALGPQGRGQYFAVVTAAGLISQTLNLGLTSSNVFLGARDRASIWPLLMNSVWLAAGAAAVGCGAVLMFGPKLVRALVVPDEMLWAVCIISAATLLWNLVLSLLVAMERFAATNLWQVGNALLTLAAIVSCALLGATPTQFALATAATATITAVGLCMFIARGRTASPAFSWPLARAGIGFSARAYGTLLLGYFLQRSGAGLVAVGSTAVQLGEYSIASQIFDVLLIVPGSISMVLFPALVRRERDSWPEVRRTVALTVALMLVLCGLAALTAPWLIPLIFGPRYRGAVPLLWCLLPAVLAYSITSVLSQYLAARSFPLSLLVAWGLGLGLSTVIGPAMTAQHGAAGAALAQSAGSLLVCVVVLWVVGRRVTILKTEVSAAVHRIVLSNYPLSRDFRARLEGQLGSDTRFINVAELRQASGLAIVRELVKISSPQLLVATEDSASTAMLPMLQLLAALTRARALGSIDGALKIRSFGRWRAASYGVGLAFESLRAGIDFLRCRADLRRLAQAARSVPTSAARGAVAYLNCNLWFGLKAGGSVGHISGVANSLMDHGYALTFFAVGERLLVDERAQHVQLEPPQMLAIPLETTYYRFNRKCVTRIRAQLRRAPVEFIYQRLSLGNYAGVALSRELGIPLVLEYNGSEAWVSKNWGRALRFHDTAALAEDVNIRHAHLVVTVSDVLRDELLARGVQAERIVTYPNCIDPKAFDPGLFPIEDRIALRHELGFEPADTIATFIGTFGQWHGVEVLANAVRRLVLDHRAELDALRLRFLLIGDGQKMPLVRAALADIDAAPYVRLTGLVPQRSAPRYLAASDMLLSPHVANADGTRFFGSPTKLFEYMAMSRGIIASDLDQIGEVLQPAVRLSADGTGFTSIPEGAVSVLVPPGDEAALVRAILLLGKEAALRESLGRNARHLALSRYTWGDHVDAILTGFARVQPASGHEIHGATES